MFLLSARQLRFNLRLAAFAIPFLLSTIAADDAFAQGGPFQRYSERWYGQNFYDHQRTGFLDFHHRNHIQHNGGFYGPAMIYSRQYGDEYGYRSAPPFVPPLPNLGISYGVNSVPYQ